MTFFVGPQIFFCTPSCFCFVFLTSSNLFWTSLKINSLEPPQKISSDPLKKYSGATIYTRQESRCLLSAVPSSLPLLSLPSLKALSHPKTLGDRKKLP